jgi:hypothetical protein
VETIIFQCDTFAVWLVQDSYDVWWHSARDVPKGLGEITARVAQLEAVQIKVLDASTRCAYRALVGEGLTRAFDGDLGAARSTLDYADAFARARLEECARRWHLVTALAAGGLALVGVVILALERVCGSLVICQALPVTPVYCTLMGMIGAAFSIVTRAGKISADPAAGLGLHLLEVLSRITAGAAAGFLASLAIVAGLFFPQLKASSLSAFMLMGFVAGVSERLIPNLVSSIEAQTSTSNHEPRKTIS